VTEVGDQATGLVFDIQGYSVHDGPGCRTLVFLSGCPLRCSWCANPEGQQRRPRLMFREKQCVHRHYRCASACGRAAVQIIPGGNPYPQFDRSICRECETRDCVAACLNQALKTAGQFYTVAELMAILTRDQGFWGAGGGVTFSGGEPLSQPEFLQTMLKQCQASYIHTAVETSAHVDADLLLAILPWTDWLLVDIKHMNPAAHRAETGAGNERILKNVEALACTDWGGRLIIRVPIIPGYNDTAENLRATAGFVRELALKEVNLLPFHRLGTSKYEQLGLDYGRYTHLEPPSQETLRSHQQIFLAAGLACYVGSETPF
jgi:pyruvate formate lyase activating enzyme